MGMSMKSRTITTALLASIVGACSTEAPVVEVTGSCADVYASQVCTWAKTQGSDLLEVGAVVPIASIEYSPAEQPMVWPPVAVAVLEIPEAAQHKSGLTHFTMYWETGGHPPVAFLTPHFDFHFYTITTAERNAIDCVDLSKPEELPATYALPDIQLPPHMAEMMGVPVLTGLCVQQMGMHAIPAPEAESTEPFHASMVVGYTRGKPIFIEPMVAKTMLMERKSFDLLIPQIPGLASAHPTKFRAEYDATKQEYRMTFSAFATGS
jgi:hypothetical protein